MAVESAECDVDLCGMCTSGRCEHTCHCLPGAPTHKHGEGGYA